MTESADAWFDRKRLKAKLTYWRTLALLALCATGASLIWHYTSPTSSIGTSYIARITVEGVIADDAKRDALLKDIADNKHIKALIVRFDTPGGTTVGGEELYERLNTIAQKKPVVAVMRTVCASAGYMAAMGANYLLARETTITGSIGVLMQSVEISELADKLGVHSVTITGGEFKDAPSMFRKPTERELDAVRPLVTDTHTYFINLVKTHRKLDGDALTTATDGRVFTGRQALDRKLIDAIGGEEEALAWLKKEKKIPTDQLDVRDMKAESELDGLKKWLESVAPIGFLTQMPTPLDGLVSIWHPAFR